MIEEGEVVEEMREEEVSYDCLNNSLNALPLNKRGTPLTTAASRKFWLEFFSLYEQLPSLWNAKSLSYTNRTVKAREYDVLVAKCREVWKDADRQFVAQKINNYRTSFRKEYNKVKASELKAVHPDDVHKPSLWYYHHLLFTVKGSKKKPAVDQDDLIRYGLIGYDDSYNNGYSSVKVENPDMGEDEDEEMDSEDNGDLENIVVEETSHLWTPDTKKPSTPANGNIIRKPATTTTSQSLSSKQKMSNQQVEVVMIDPDMQENTYEDEIEEEYMVVGRRLGFQLKSLSPTQRNIAEKLVSDIIFMGKCNRLNENTNIR